jgi:hypothetical protein
MVPAADSKLTCEIFNDALIIKGHLAINGKFMANEKLQIFRNKRLWSGRHRLTSWNLPGVTEENYYNLRQGQR